MELGAVRSRAESPRRRARATGGRVRLPDELGRRRSDAEGPCHVGVAAGPDHADRGRGRWARGQDGAVSWLVADRRLGAMGDDHGSGVDQARSVKTRALRREAPRTSLRPLAKPGLLASSASSQPAAPAGRPRARRRSWRGGAGEELSVGLQLDPVRAQMVCRLKGNEAGATTSSTPACRQARSTSPSALVRAELLHEQLVDAELIVGDDLEIRSSTNGGARWGSRRRAGAVPLHVDERSEAENGLRGATRVT